MKQLVLGAAILSFAATAQAQDSGAVAGSPPAPAPLQALRPVTSPQFVLPANTEVLLRTNQEVTTKGKRWKEGDTFDLSVVHDVRLGSYVIIPRGSREVGRITFLTNKGAFGKSGKMDVTLEYVEVNGQRIDVSGEYRQEGEGNTVATVGGVILAGVFAGFITGKSGIIPQGRELMARTRDDLPVELPEGATLERGPVGIRAVAPASAGPAAAPVPVRERKPVIRIGG